MKINEVVTLHPSVAAKSEYDMLWHAGEEEMDGIIGYIMDDRNPERRRLNMLRHLDELMGETQDEYSMADLQNFMYDQDDPPTDWRGKLRQELKKYAASKESYSWSHDKEPGTTYDFTKLDDMSAEEMVQFAKDLKIPPYHLAMVDETQDDEISTGEYEICQTCGGEGCNDCEEGLTDITGMHKIPNFSDLDNA